MSHKSRQKKGRTLLSKLLPVWMLIPILVISLGMGILCVAMPWLRQPIPYEDTIPLGIFFLVAATYAAWSLCMTWKYRRLTP